MYQNVPITERVKRIRKKYRTTKPKIDLNRYKLVTEFYMENPDITGILKRAKNLRNLFEKMPTPVNEDELIVGFAAETYRGCALYPENSFWWFMDEIDTLPTRDVDPYDIDQETYDYIKKTGHFWDKNCMSAIIDQYLPEGYKDKNVVGSGVLNFVAKGNTQNPIGHFCGNFWTVVDKGFGAIRDEAKAKMDELEEKGIQGDEGKRYSFYRAVYIVSEGIIIYTKRYAKECEKTGRDLYRSKA